jgi:protein CWC15
LCGHPKIDNECRQPGQGGDADPKTRDLRTQLLEAEAAHFAKTTGGTGVPQPPASPKSTSVKRLLDASPGGDGEAEEDLEAKRRRVLEATREIDADSDVSNSDSSDEDRCV